MTHSINGNTSYPCVDCGETPKVTLVQHAHVLGKLRHWHVCAQRFLKQGGDTQQDHHAAP